jgi:hypothetical protein
MGSRQSHGDGQGARIMRRGRAEQTLQVTVGSRPVDSR